MHNATTAGVVPVVTELLTSERLALSRDQVSIGSIVLDNSIQKNLEIIAKLKMNYNVENANVNPN